MSVYEMQLIRKQKLTENKPKKKFLSVQKPVDKTSFYDLIMGLTIIAITCYLTTHIPTLKLLLLSHINL